MPSRSSPTTRVLGVAVSAVLAAGGRLVYGGAQARPASMPSFRPAPIAVARPPALPWPSTGQAAVETTGQAGGLGVHGERRPVPIASVTKVMTALVVLRDHPLGRNAAGPSIRVDRRLT
ncbi:hypothetical protein ACSDR0_38460 [Streptosporangium sp. G11]|uniref:hypothetical protein n=1 Tax=Streptosporangium sp. G11 TaxID=3436926 RepID=UPI003EBB254B